MDLSTLFNFILIEQKNLAGKGQLFNNPSGETNVKLEFMDAI